MSETTQFMDCTSLNISFDVYGYATLTYTLISDGMDVDIITNFKGVKGYPTYIRQEPMIEAKGFYTTQVTILGVKNTES